jgi:hypothetical protein
MSVAQTCSTVAWSKEPDIDYLSHIYLFNVYVCANSMLTEPYQSEKKAK